MSLSSGPKFDTTSEITMRMTNGGLQGFTFEVVHPINPLPPSDAVRKQKKKFRGSFQFSIVKIEKKKSPLWKPEI